MIKAYRFYYPSAPNANLPGNKQPSKAISSRAKCLRCRDVNTCISNIISTGILYGQSKNRVEKLR
jgi:hypothetical protein